jgi:hypothetical protein
LPYCHEAVLDRIGRDRLGVGGVNHIADLERWMDLDIALLVTDFPDRAVAVRSRIAEKR